MMSMMGTLLVDSVSESAFMSCRRAVSEADSFVGFVRPQLGSGRDRGEKTITYQEFEEALKLNKPSLFFVDYRVVMAYQYCKSYAQSTQQRVEDCWKDLSMVKRESLELYNLLLTYGDADAVSKRVIGLCSGYISI